MLEAVKTQAKGEDVYIRADDPELVHLMYEEDSDWQSELGEYVEDYYNSSRGPEPDAGFDEVEDTDELDDEFDDEDGGGSGDPLQTLKDFRDLVRGAPSDGKSAGPHAGLAFIRVAATADRFVTVDPTFSEAQLEAFIIQHWENIDWGFESPLHFVGSQIQLDPETRDRADIIAQSGAGQPVVIELKIGEAKPRDISQLQAYMTHLERRGKGKPFGVLVAESFPHRVRNAALQNRRIRLLRFRVPS